MKRALKKGFTLVEMLVVIGIILILMSAIMGGVMKMKKSAMRAKAQDLVSSAGTALVAVLQADKNWPGYLLRGAAVGDPIMGNDACQPLISHKAFSLSHVNDHNSDGDTYYRLTGADRCGVVDPWGAAVLKKLNPSISGNSALSRKVPSGGTIRDHLLRYAVDDDYDGIVVANVGGKTVRVRASAIVWGAGPDGKIDEYGKSSQTDDFYSWTRSQVQK